MGPDVPERAHAAAVPAAAVVSAFELAVGVDGEDLAGGRIDGKERGRGRKEGGVGVLRGEGERGLSGTYR